MNNEIEDLFLLLRKKRRLLVLKEDYADLANFFIGYELGLHQNSTAKELNSFADWLGKKEQVDFSIHWSSYFLQKANNDEELAINFLIDYMQEYVESTFF